MSTNLSPTGLPSVIFVGPLKTGTTWIYDYLSGVSAVALPKNTKETFYFDRYYRGGEGAYRALFPRDAELEGRRIVEVAPSYAGSRENVFQRIANDIKDVRVVVSVRDPIKRTLSQFWHEVRYGYYENDIEKYLKKDDPIFERSRYPHILEEAVRLFGADKVRVLVFEELCSDAVLFCSRVCECVEVPFVPPAAALLESVSNEGRVPRSVLGSRLATRSVDFLKSMGMHAVPAVARKLGVRTLLERKRVDGEHEVSAETLARVGGLLGFDYSEFLESAKPYIPGVPAGLRSSQGS